MQLGEVVDLQGQLQLVDTLLVGCAILEVG